MTSQPERGPITYGTLSRRDHFEEVVRLQQRIWEFSPQDAIPWSLMRVVGINGGVILGAFERDRLVGFVFSQPGWRDGRSYLYSKMLGVLPAYRGRGVGRTLKRRQRREALRRGYRRILWTFDPLERGSAMLNLGYLGVTCPQFEIDFYGQGGVGGLHMGLPSDRLLAEWTLSSPRAVSRARRRRIPALHAPPEAAVLVEHPERQAEPHLSSRAHLPALIALPPGIQKLKRHQPAKASAWQRAMRQALSRTFRQGGSVTGIVRLAGDPSPREYYLVEKLRSLSGRPSGRRAANQRRRR
jgi:predicted GNAT superfamily acetyltransferase